jgi:NAD(P)-dependent dehydrogenase (short-subunit alcohol dehydrogenase family)
MSATSPRGGTVVALTDAGTLGRAVARRLVARGHRVALYHPALVEQNAAAMIDELGADRVMAEVVELGDWDALARAVDATAVAFAAPAHAVLAFAVGRSGGGPLHAGGDDAGLFPHVTLATVEAPYRAMRALLPAMARAGGGSVTVLGHRLAERPWEAPGAAVYAAAANAVAGLVRATAEELRAHGVRVNAILTSLVDTPDARAELPGFDPSGWVSVDSVAATIEFLCSDGARDISGALIPVYGRS